MYNKIFMTFLKKSSISFISETKVALVIESPAPSLVFITINRNQNVYIILCILNIHIVYFIYILYVKSINLKMFQDPKLF